MLFDKSGFAKPIQCGEKFMTNREMMEIAMRQSAEDMGCREEDFKTNRNVVFPLKLGKNARKYLKEEAYHVQLCFLWEQYCGSFHT